MRDDLLGAKAAIDWAVAQIELLEMALTRWQNSRPYRIVKERDPQTREYLVVAVDQHPPPLTFNVWVGAILNSLRSSLDILAAVLAERNGVKTNRNRHFPIFDSCLDMIDPLRGLDGTECKKWLSDHERAAIKSLKPYKGGDGTIWPLHQLDIIRKHERLITARATFNGILEMSSRHHAVWGTSAGLGINEKTVLARFGADFDIREAQRNAFLSLDIRFNEAAFGYADEQAFTVLCKFHMRVREIIDLFEK